jgi:translation initiation factor 5B
MTILDNINENNENNEDYDSDNNQNENIIINKDKKKKKKKTNNKSNKEIVKKLNPIALLAQQHLKLIEEENARIKAEQELEEKKIKEEAEQELQRLKAIKNEKERKHKLKQDKIKLQKDAGTYKTKSEKEKIKKNQDRLEQLKKSGILIEDGKIVINTINSNIIVNDDFKNNIINDDLKNNIINDDLKNNIIKDDKKYIDYGFRSPILCIMGHVDTGKTKLLDKIRDTKVQDGEAGGITQQIGASFIPYETLILKSKVSSKDIKIPGLLMIDTPGHEAFTNLRNRGSSLCDIAIIIIDIVHGLEQQTIQSINILKDSNIKFIFALNKIDRLYGWKSQENRNIHESFKANQISLDEFTNRLNDINCQIMSLGLNSKLFWENNSLHDTISICPISAKTGEGVCDLLKLITTLCQEQLTEQITYTNKLKCIVMEKTITEGLGASVDVILINGELKKGDEITFQTIEGMKTKLIRNLLTPPPNKESRITTEYIHHDSVKGSLGVKIVANDIDKIIVGSQIIFSSEEFIEVTNISNNFKLEAHGVTVFASTQGALEALMQYLQNECKPAIPVSEVVIGNVMKKHITKSIINFNIDNKEFSTILAFNVNIEDDVLELANKNGIKIFSAEIIYHLFDFYIKYRDQIINERKLLYKSQSVFPCILKILEKHIYNKKNPLIFGVIVQEGNLHIGTPIIIPETNVVLGKVISIQLNNKEVPIGKKGTEVCIKVENNENTTLMYGRHFDHKNTICSSITRSSLDVIKNYFRDEVTTDDVKLLVKLKKLLNIN